MEVVGTSFVAEVAVEFPSVVDVEDAVIVVDTTVVDVVDVVDVDDVDDVVLYCCPVINIKINFVFLLFV